MNWLDILMLIVCIVIFMLGFVWLIFAIKEDSTGAGIVRFFIGIGASLFIGVLTWLCMDFKSGKTVGEITSVDKNFFGTTAVYIKVNNNSEERYCVESDNIVDLANEYVGKKVQTSYGKRFGFYSTGRCSNAPIDEIRLIEE